MILSGLEIKKHLGKSIVIDPFDENRLNPNSYNLRLDNKLFIYNSAVLDMKKRHDVTEVEIPDSGYKLKPNVLYLGKTVEKTKTDNLVPMLEGRSSVGRLGIGIHLTAGFGDIGFDGYWTLEIFCIQPVIIYPFVEICQIYYHTTNEYFETYKSGKYQNNTNIQQSKMYQDF